MRWFTRQRLKDGENGYHLANYCDQGWRKWKGTLEMEGRGEEVKMREREKEGGLRKPGRWKDFGPGFACSTKKYTQMSDSDIRRRVSLRWKEEKSKKKDCLNVKTVREWAKSEWINCLSGYYSNKTGLHGERERERENELTHSNEIVKGRRIK